MEKQTITIPLEQFEDLMKGKAAIHALQCYVNAEKYLSIEVMCGIVGIEFRGDD